MYKNLEAELARQGVAKKDVASLLRVRDATLSDKIRGKYKFKVNEAMKIKKTYFPHLSLEYLFEEKEG